MQRFARSTRPGPQSQGQGWEQNLNSPCRSCSLPEERICTSTWVLSQRFVKEKAQSATEECWPLRKASLGLGLFRRKRIEQLEPWGLAWGARAAESEDGQDQGLANAFQLLLKHRFPPLLGAAHGKRQRKWSHFNSFAPFLWLEFPPVDTVFEKDLLLTRLLRPPLRFAEQLQVLLTPEQTAASQHIWKWVHFLLKMGNQKGRHPAFEATFGNIYIYNWFAKWKGKMMQAPDRVFIFVRGWFAFFFPIIAQFAQLVVVCTNHLIIAHHNYSQFLSQSVFIWF